MTAELPTEPSARAKVQVGALDAWQTDGIGSLSVITQPSTAPVSSRSAPPTYDNSVRGTPYRLPDEPSRARWPKRITTGLPLLATLIVQATLSLKLVWSNTAFQDEALYLWAGRLEWSHWLHGTPVPPFPTYFSGAPVIYPAVGALANSIGGLAAARIVSLVFMLAATSLLWCTASRLFGRRAGFFAAALWAVLGPTLKLGAFATFDAMSLCLMALAAWCAVRSSGQRHATGWTLATGAAMILSDLTAYSSLIFDPIIFVLIGISALDTFGWNVAKARCTSLIAYVVTGFAILFKLGGPWYAHGIVITVFERAPSNSPATAVIAQAWSWTTYIVCLVGAAIIISMIVERTWPARLMPLLMLVALLVVPLEQARIHTLTSLDKHVAVSTWFAAIAAGYCIDRLIDLVRLRMIRILATASCAIAMVIPVGIGLQQAQELFASWPNAASFVTWFQPIAKANTGPMLVETPTLAEYYTAAGDKWKLWSSTFNITLPSGHVVDEHGRVGFPDNASEFARYISEGYFSIVALHHHGFDNQLDHDISRILERNPNYRIVAIIPYGDSNYTVWKREKGDQ